MAARSDVNEKQASAMSFFKKQCVNLLNLHIEIGFSKMGHGPKPLQY
jgi:hypothetical protein